MYSVVHTFVVLFTDVHVVLFVCFMCRTSHPVSRKASDLRMPKIPSALKPELSPSSRASSGLIGRGKLGKQEFTGL